MRQKWLLRGVVAAGLALALVLGWQQVRPPPRAGDVPYVPTRLPVVDRMLELAEVDADDLVFDLGSGDGRIVIRAAQRFGARGRGFELDPLLITESRAAAVTAGVDERVSFVEGDLFEADLRPATAVTLFLLPTVNLALRPRLLAELAPGTPVVSHMWDMGEWSPDIHEVLALDPPADVYQWIVPAALGGVWDVSTAVPDQGGVDAAPASAFTLRLLQRFQELEGEITLDGRTVAVAGTVDGDRFTVETMRARSGLDAITLTGRVIDDTLAGTIARGSASTAQAVSGVRRPARIEGAWRIGAAERPFVAQWVVRLWRQGNRWTGSRGGVDTEGTTATTAILPGSPGREPAASGSEMRMTDVYLWGSSVAFVVGASDGSGRRISYYGLVEGDRISGVAHDGGTLVPWRGVRVPAVQ
jgi:hypothetical protein